MQIDKGTRWVCHNPDCGKEYTPAFKAHSSKYCSVSCKNHTYRTKHGYRNVAGANKSNAKKTEQLGMDAAKASRLLKKMVLFNFIKQLGLDCCYRCGKPI